MVTISGAVKYQGTPVEQGEIVLSPADGVGPAASAPIENGSFRLTCTLGEKRVRITATKETGRMIEGAMGGPYPERVDLIPPQFNTASTLTRTVVESTQEFNFALE